MSQWAKYPPDDEVVFPTSFIVNQGTSPWIISGSVSASQADIWSVGRTWTLSFATDSANVSGSSVSVSNFPSSFSVTQGTSPWVISGTMTLPANASTLTEQQAQTSLLTSIEADLSDENVIGTISATNGAITVDTEGHSSVYFNVTGTFVATLLFEAEAGDGVWNNVAAVNQNNGIFFFVTVPNVSFIAPVGGFNQFRIRAASYTSGTVNITINSGAGTNVVEIFQPVATALHGTMRVSDGTTNAAIKAASTAAVAADPALVVAISPNNTPAAASGRTASQLIRNDYSSTNVTTGAYVQLVASTASVINKLWIFDSSGQDFVLAVGAAASEVDQIRIPPGGWDAAVDLLIAAGSRISIKASSATASSGLLIITGLK